jgi:hypothetical protein
MLKGQEKIIRDFGGYGDAGDARDFDDETMYQNGWWWYSKDPFTYDGDCHTFHEQTLDELYRAIKRACNSNQWKEKKDELLQRSGRSKNESRG